MMLVPALLLLLPSGARAQSGGFLVLLGRDTVQIERFTRSADRLEGAVAFRSPRTRLVRYAAQLTPSGQPLRYEQSLFNGDGTPVQYDVANATFTFQGDSVIREIRNAAQPALSRMAAPAGTVPLLGASLMIPFAHSYLTYELAFAQARSSAANGEARVRLLSNSPNQTAPQATRAWFIAPDSVELDYFNVARSAFKLDAEGRLLRADWRATTYKYIVTRIAAPDVEAIAQRWATLDAAGQGMGRYSPRDTMRAIVNGANIAIDYSRPSRRGREIWGGVVPWNQVWRLGADFATQLRSDVALRIGEADVPAGVYSLWLLPSTSDAQLIINRQSGQFGTQYDARQDLVRVPMQRAASRTPVESLTISISDGQLVIVWGDASYSVAIARAAALLNHPS